MTPIYLDYNATTPLDPQVVEAMLPYLREHFGNPSSTHSYGKTTHAAVDHARQQVAALLGAQPEEIVFTGGGTEASNHALKGVRATHIITSAVEHPATLQPCTFLKRSGCKITIVGVDKFGRVNPEDVAKTIEPATALISIMHSNNEVGTLQPTREVGVLAKKHGILVHTDAAQSLGKVTVNVEELGVDLLTLAGHKLYAPKGIGVLYVRKGTKLEPLIHGAGHEGGRRAGTENVPYVVALGKACEIARQSLPQATERLRCLRDRLWSRLREAFGETISFNGHPELRLPNTLSVNFHNHVGAELLAETPDVAASTGSACHEGSVRLSSVLQAMGVPENIGRGAVRLSVGRFTTEEDIDRAAEALIRSARK